MIDPEVWGIIKRRLNLRRLGAMSTFITKTSALHQVGWFRSSKDAQSVDAKGKAIPWFTYSAIYYIKQRVKPEMRVFEYGSGNSTIWWAEHTSEVVACEDNYSWYKMVKAKLPQNARLMYRPSSEAGTYADAILNETKEFDIIVDDGSDRNACAEAAIQRLAPDGVIIFDNGDRKEYSVGCAFLVRRGFKRLDFFGLAGIDNANNVTSIFYRANNCLGI